MTATTSARPATYEELDAIRIPVEWDGFQCIMLGTCSQAGIIRRMDGTRVTVDGWRNASESRLATFATSGKWLFEV